MKRLDVGAIRLAKKKTHHLRIQMMRLKIEKVFMINRSL